ncbi:MAG: hypothetical protein KC613_02565, partial [Myxococcales bacterium]|nr:hypothetical protein [Myxococcales bacterium]
GCIPLLVDLVSCHNPQGACEYEPGGGLAGTNYRFENGARVSTDIDLDTFVVTTTYYGPGGVECGAQIIDTMGGAGGGVGAVRVRLADGRDARYGVAYDQANGDITYTCGDGSTRVFTQDQQLALQACTGGGDGEPACSGEPGGGVGGECEADSDCGDTQVCCVGVCIGEDLCFLGGRQCEADAECSDGKICCPANDRCTDRDVCVQSGWCQGDADCDGGLCCDQQCVNDGRATCGGECAGNGDCGGETPFCCDSSVRDQTWCAPDAFQCYEYAACQADDDCAAAGLTCCNGECRDFEACFTGQACEAVADCGGEGSGLLCCDSDAQGANGTCASPTGCYEGTPCNVAAGCPADLFCCARFQVDESFEGVCVGSEGICNLQLPCGSQAECGEGGECCADPALPEPMCFPVDSGCTATLP